MMDLLQTKAKIAGVRSKINQVLLSEDKDRHQKFNVLHTKLCRLKAQQEVLEQTLIED